MRIKKNYSTPEKLQHAPEYSLKLVNNLGECPHE
jgi:hypothetical protein